MMIGIAIPLAIFIVFLIVFRKKLREMREKNKGEDLCGN